MSDPFSDLPPGAAATADRLRRALAEQAASTEPRPDAYARLARRVTEEQAPSLTSSWWPTSRLVFAGVVAALVLLGGGYALTRQVSDDVPIASDPGPAEVAPGPANDGDPGGGGGRIETEVDEPDGGTGPESSESEVGEAVVPVPPVTPGPDLAPLRDSRRDAAVAFLDVLGIETTDVTVGDNENQNTATVRGPTGEFVTTLDLAEVDVDRTQGWVVAGARSPQVGIDDVVWADAENPAAGMTVRGLIDGISEPGVVAEVRSAAGGSLLATSEQVGGTEGEPVRYSATVTPAGTDWAWIVVRPVPGAVGWVQAAGSVAATGGGVATGPLSAVPVRLDGVASTEYKVVNIRAGDSDGGLNVRASPGPGDEPLAVLVPGETVQRRATPPVVVPGSGRGAVDVWWEVEAPDGTAGWVAAAYLAAPGPLADDDLGSVVEAVLAAAADPENAAMSLPVSWRAGFAVMTGGEVIDLAPRQLLGASGWRDPVTGDRSLVDLLAWPIEGAAASDVQVSMNAFEFGTDPARDAAQRDFGSLPHATASYTGADGRPRQVHVFVEREPTRPAAVGMIIEIG